MASVGLRCFLFLSLFAGERATSGSRQAL